MHLQGEPAMLLTKINNSVNPFSKGHCQARQDFKALSQKQKAVAIALTALAGLSTLLLGAIGAFATFKALVHAFKSKTIDKGTDPVADKTHGMGTKCIGTNINEDDREVDSSSDDEKCSEENADHTLLLDIEETDGQTVNNTSKLTNEHVRDQQCTNEKYSNIPTLQLLNECPIVPLNDEALIDEATADTLTKEQKELLVAAGERIRQAPREEQTHLLEILGNNPGAFLFILSQILDQSDNTPHKVEDFLDYIPWPSNELKSKAAPLMLKKAIELKALTPEQWDKGYVSKGSGTGFACNRVVIDAQAIFGSGDFITKPKSLSDNLLRGLTMALDEKTKEHIHHLEVSHSVNTPARVGIELVIDYSEEARIPTSAWAPLLPYLATIPGLVSLKLTNDVFDRKTTTIGFGDDDINGLLEIFTSQPYLQQIDLDISNMTQQGKDKYHDKRKVLMKQATHSRIPTCEEMLTHVKQSQS